MADDKSNQANQSKAENDPKPKTPNVPTAPALSPPVNNGAPDEHIHNNSEGPPEPTLRWFARADCWTAIFTGALVAVGLATAILLLNQLAEMRDTTIIAQQQLEASERPWLSADIAISGPLVFDKDGAHITMAIRLRNIGHSPAIRTAYRPELFAILGSNDTVRERDKFCNQLMLESAEPSNAAFADTIFPTNESVTVSPWMVPMNKESIDFDSGRFRGIMHPTIIFCVAYRSGFGKSQYDTSYVYDIFRNDPTHPVDPNISPFAITPEMVEISPEHLLLQLRTFGGIHAN
jgi:hypothetical protein